MATNEQALVQFESGVVSYPMQALTNTGDNILFNSPAALFSQSSGNAPVIRADGIINGGAITPSAGTNSIEVATVLYNQGGVEKTLTAGSVAITRPATNVARVISITITAAGAFAAIPGTDGTGTTFSETRGAAGAPPFIPVGSVEVGQVRITSSAAAVVTQAEIYQVDGNHKETADFPPFETVDEKGQLKFNSALPLSHTGGKTKDVWASFSSPVFQDQPFGNDFTPAEESVSVSSTQVYGATVGSSSKSLSAASFTAILKDGITDPIIAKKGAVLWFKFFQDRAKPAHILTQGRVALGRTFAASDQPKVTVTIAADKASIEKAN